MFSVLLFVIVVNSAVALDRIYLHNYIGIRYGLNFSTLIIIRKRIDVFENILLQIIKFITQ